MFKRNLLDSPATWLLKSSLVKVETQSNKLYGIVQNIWKYTVLIMTPLNVACRHSIISYFHSFRCSSLHNVKKENYTVIYRKICCA